MLTFKFLCKILTV